MPEVRKISVSMPPDVVDRVKLAAAAAGESVSAWLTVAAARQLDEQSRLEIGRIAAERLVTDHERDFGPIPQGVLDEVDAFLAGTGAATLPEPRLGPDLQARIFTARTCTTRAEPCGSCTTRARWWPPSGARRGCWRCTAGRSDRRHHRSCPRSCSARSGGEVLARRRCRPCSRAARSAPLDEIVAKQGGQLCGHAGTADLADAVVVVLARRLGAGVVTSDPDDIGRLAEAWRLRLPVFVV